MEFLLRLYTQVFDKYQPWYWGWDGGGISYREVPFFRPQPIRPSPDPCYAQNHGHLPGDNFYKEWRNIQKFLAEIRRRYPRMLLEQYYGMKRWPWALRYLQGDDNYYETNGADINRFQTLA